MRCPIYCVSYEISTKNGDPTIFPRLFVKKRQAEFYFNAKLEELKKTYCYAMGEIGKDGSPWTMFEDEETHYWNLSNSLVHVSYTLQMICSDFETQGPEYSRLEEIICDLVDYLYADIGDRAETKSVLQDSIGLDDYELAVFGWPADGDEEQESEEETPIKALAPVEDYDPDNVD